MITKTKLIDEVTKQITSEYEVPKSFIKKVVDTTIDTLKGHIKNGNEIRLIGFISLAPRKTKGEKITIYNFKTKQREQIELQRNIYRARISKKAR